MNAEHLVLLASGSAVAGAIVQQNVSLPIVSGNVWYQAALGAGIAALGYFVIKMDGVGDAVEAFGVGYAAGALLSVI
jgi:hypothetical protein